MSELRLKSGVFRTTTPDLLTVGDGFDVDGDLFVYVKHHRLGEAHTFLKRDDVRRLRKHLKRALKARDQ